MRLAISLTAMLLIVGAAPEVRADTIFDNLSSDTTYASNNGWLVAGPVGNPIGPFESDHSETFVAGITASLSQVLIAMWQVDSAPSAAFDLSLTDSSNNVLEAWSGVTAPLQGATVPVVVLDSVSNALLHSGQTYTLTATPSGDGTGDGWEFVNNSLTPDLEQSGYRVLGIAASSTPEPGSLLLCGLGIVSFGGMAWMKRRSVA